MANGKNERVIVCRSESEFEERFLPRSRERKKREKGLSEPDLFEAQLARELHECLQKTAKGRGTPTEGFHRDS